MIEIEIIGNAEALSGAESEVAALAQAGVRKYNHRGIGGEAAMVGLIAGILPMAIPKLLEILKSRLVRDRTLVITLNGFEIAVADIKEATDLLDALEARGLLTKPS